MVKKKKRIRVVGSGVIGLTSALQLALEGHEVSVVAAAEGNQTTSSIAAAFWYPFWTGKEPDHSYYDPVWAAEAYRVFENLVNDTKTGISEVQLFEYFTTDMSDDAIDGVVESMWWRSLPECQFRSMEPSELSSKSIRELNFKAGISFRTFVVNMSDYLTYLKQRCIELGVSFEFRVVSDLATEGDGHDIVVNCTGLGSRRLATDDKEDGRFRTNPVEGVVLRTTPLPEVTGVSLIHTGEYFDSLPAYIVPRGGTQPDIILGGTITQAESLNGTAREACEPQHLDWDSLGIDHWTKPYTDRIIADCFALEPALTKATILQAKVGYRPRRTPAIRLEKQGNIIHNYGHAGAGITLSWGCADLVCRLSN